MKLADVLAESPFPIFGIPAQQWDGPAFVGDLSRRAGALEAVQLTYLDGLDGATMGAVVSTVAFSGDDGRDALETHVTSFAARFAPQEVARWMRRRANAPFRRERFRRKDVPVTFAGARVGAALMTHDTFPLQLMRVAVVRPEGPLDVAVGAWRLEALPLAERVQRVDATIATAFDRLADVVYPPAEWFVEDE